MSVYAAVTNNGELFKWGQEGAALGFDSNDNAMTPVKIMENVKDVSLAPTYSAALTEDGRFFMWGAVCGESI